MEYSIINPASQNELSIFWRSMNKLGSCILLLVIASVALGQGYPEDFQIETISDELEQPSCIVHSSLGVSYVSDLRGSVWPLIDDQLASEPLVDLTEEVARWKDHGLMSIALHPDFSQNGYLYLFYVVDRHHLIYYGTEEYHPDSNDYVSATIGRLVRYQVDVNNPTSLSSQERFTLIGETKESGIPICATSHGIGDVIFGTDGTLLITVGDSNSPGSLYNGEGDPPEAGYELQAIEDGILRLDENIGSFRAQKINTYCGKILRIDPETGLGLDSNPFFDPSQPDQPISKVWSLGLRNPFRITLVPNTGSTNPEDGNPGDILFGDVGDWIWEEINLANSPGQNFGWPIYHGPETYYYFVDLFTPDVTRPLPEGCPQEYLFFQDAIVDPSPQHNEEWESPCEGTLSPLDYHLFVHERPILSYRNWLVGPPAITAVSDFDNEGNPSYTSISELDIEGNDDFIGAASIGGAYYQGGAFPTEYYGAYFQTDYIQWLRVFHFDEFGEIEKIELWDESIGSIVYTSFNPYNESIYLCGIFPGAIKKITYGGNLRPIIEMTPDTVYGAGPLDVEFDASNSYDPEETELTFNWDFGDGIAAVGPNVSHVFTAPDMGPISYTVSLTVTDADGKINTANALISLNNTPPQASITSFEDGDFYSINEVTQLGLNGEFIDSESDLSELDIRWRVFLHHNTHFHLEETFFTQDASASIEPLGCREEEYWYRIELSVSDPQGLRTVVEQEIFPNCNSDQEYSEELTIYPNPVSYNYFMKLPADPGSDISVEYYNTQGKFIQAEVVKYDSAAAAVQLNASQLEQGVYILRIKSANWSKSMRLLVMRD